MLHELGAPESVLVAGKPHLGTDRLVRILRAFRRRLQSLGVDVRFGTRAERLLTQGDRCCGVQLRGAALALLLSTTSLKARNGDLQKLQHTTEPLDCCQQAASGSQRPVSSSRRVTAAEPC